MTLDEYRKMRAETPIANATVNATDACNLRCKYCFTAQNGRVAPTNLGKDVILFMLKELERTGKDIPLIFSFFGGEPTLRFDEFIRPTIDWAKKEGIHVNFSITSNGTLLDESRLSYLRDNGCNLLLSIDGDRETQDDQRPMAGDKSSFDAINIPLILKYYPQVIFRSTLEPRNADKILHNYLFARNCGFKEIFLCPNSYAEWGQDDIRKAMEQISACVYLMYEEAKQEKDFLRLSSFSHFFAQQIQRFKGREFIAPKGKSVARCGLGTLGIGVKTTGEINGCQEHNTYFDDDIFLIGDIYNGINEEKHLELLNTYLSSEVSCESENIECKNCKYYANCHSDGGCPSQNLGAHGGMGKMSPGFCSLYRFQMELSEIILSMAARETTGDFERIVKSLAGGE